MQDWAKLWHIRDTRDPVPLPNAEQLLQAARQHAATLPEISLGHLAHVLKHLPDRAAGPDGIPTQLLRTAPPQALQPLRQTLRCYELHGILPTQMIQSLIVMLPKNEQCERPITLTSTVYRL